LGPYRALKSLQTGASVNNADDTAAKSSSICIFSSTELIKDEAQAALFKDPIRTA
jgi:hypothetical protein